MTALEGRVAIVSGAGRGIGRGIALRFAAEGATLAVVDRSAALAHAVAAEITAAGGRAIALPADVSDEQQVDGAFGDAVAALGSPWVLVNCAGIGTATAFLEMTATQWRAVHAVNLDGTFFAARAAARAMVAAGEGGRIINIGSQIAMKGADRMAHYVSSKAAVHGLTRALARELAPHRITVNTIAPGPVETDMLLQMPPEWLDAKRAEIPLGRFGQVEDVVPAALLLASADGGGFITGAVVNVSGGDVMCD
ncbi:MAG: SDR family oxidoreductase [Solirubrobacteraceae bacterium]|jgi:3-oxoacyl-[acyl-carrier protein] reductase